MDAAGASQALTVEMTPTEVTLTMPNLFGLAVNVAIEQANTADSWLPGSSTPMAPTLHPAATPEPAKTSPVLNQVPEAGEIVPKNTPIQLHISAKVAQQVKVPNLAGLTMTEAKAQLEALGLAVGDTNTLGR